MILVTGSHTLMGRKLVSQLLKAGEKIRSIDYKKPSDDSGASVEFLQDDLLNEVLLKKACSGIDTIFHLLDVKSPKMKGKRYMKQVNTKGTRNLLNAAAAANVERIIFLSTYEIYGKTKKIPTRRDDRKRPKTRYGKQKLKAEKILLETTIKGKPTITIFRPSLVIGPGTENPIILITLLMALGMEDANRLYLTGDGDNRFQLIHPDEVVDAIVLSLNNSKANGQIYNLGSDNVPTQLDQIVKLKEQAKLDCTIKHLSPLYTRFLSVVLRPLKINYLTKEHLFYLLNNLILDCQKVKTDLGWETNKTNLDILFETIKWYKEKKL